MRTLFSQRLAHHACDPHAPPAMAMPEREVGYPELNRAVDACAAWLARRGCAASEVVDITVADEYLHTVASLALPDGYALLLTGSLITLLPSTLGSVAVDPIASFAPVTKLAEPPIVIVAHPSLNVSTLAELIEVARQRRGKLAYATAGVGTVQHLIAWIIARDAGVEMLHIPYANTGQALKDVQSGEVPVYFTFLGPIDGMLRSGQLKALAVVSDRRIRAWPDMPTVSELGFKDAAASPWNGVLAPAGTPPEIVNRLHREFARIVELPEVKDRFATMGMEPIATSPDRFSAEIREAVVRWPP